MGTEVREELKAKQLEKVIYFAANLVTWVDDEQPARPTCPNLEAELLGEREAIEHDRENALARRHEQLEAELKELEDGGAKEADLRARQQAAEKDLAAIREEYEAELDLLNRTWDEFRDLFARKIIDDEMLWRELKERYGEYFEGGMGADAIKSLLDRIDLDEEEDQAPATRSTPQEGQRPLSAQRKQKAIKRLKIVTAFNRRRRPPAAA